jgi:hypothetical protein
MLTAHCSLFFAFITTITAEKISKMTLSTVRAGKATLRQAIAIELQPPMRKWGMASATRLAIKTPMTNPRSVLLSVKTIMQAPNAAINKPMPISARADQWQMGRLLAAGPQQPLCSGTAQQSSISSPIDAAVEAIA